MAVLLFIMSMPKTPREWINVNNDPNNKGIDVEEAASNDKEPSLDKEIGIYDSMFFKKGYDFTDDTNPSSKTNDGQSTLVSITNFSEVSDVMTADVYVATPHQPRHLFLFRTKR